MIKRRAPRGKLALLLALPSHHPIARVSPVSPPVPQSPGRYVAPFGRRQPPSTSNGSSEPISTARPPRALVATFLGGGLRGWFVFRGALSAHLARASLVLAASTRPQTSAWPQHANTTANACAMNCASRRFARFSFGHFGHVGLVKDMREAGKCVCAHSTDLVYLGALGAIWRCTIAGPKIVCKFGRNLALRTRILTKHVLPAQVL